jgi:hypothetical protein
MNENCIESFSEQLKSDIRKKLGDRISANQLADMLKNCDQIASHIEETYRISKVAEKSFISLQSTQKRRRRNLLEQRL